MKTNRYTYLFACMSLCIINCQQSFAQGLCPTVSVGSNSPVCSGNSLNLTSTVSGGIAPYTYSWTGPNGFTSSQANPSIPNTTTAATGTYSLQVTDLLSCTVSASTIVTVNQTPTVAAIDGPSGGCVGSTIQLTNTTSGGVWSSSNTAVATVNASGVVTMVANGSATISYTVTANGCSNTATKAITAASVVLSPDVMECNNGNNTYTGDTAKPYHVIYSNNNGGDSFLWTITDGSTGNVVTNVYTSSNNTSKYPTIKPQTGNWYTIQVQYTTNGITCSATHKVYKEIQVTGTIQSSQDTTVCFNTSPVGLVGSVSIVANTLTWYTYNGTGTFSSPNSITTSYTPSAADKTAGQVYIVFQASTSLNATGKCGSLTVSDTMVLRILPNNTGTNSTASICSDQLFSHTPSSSQAGSSFSWTSSFTTGSGSGNVASGTGNINHTLVNNSTTTDAVVQYVITPSYSGCTGTPYTVTVTIKPRPALTLTNNATAICTGAAASIQFASSISGTVYTWSSAVISGTAGGNSNNATPSTNNTITDVLTNTTTATAVVRYTVTATTPAGCTTTSTTDVTVHPTPTAANAGTDQSLCNATSATLNGNTPVVGTGTWTRISGPNTPAITNAASPGTTVTGLITGTYVFRWTVTNGICTASQDDVTVVVNPLTAAGMLDADQTVCAPTNSGTHTVSGYTGNIINWQTSTDNGATWNTSNVTANTFSFTNLTTTTLYKASVQSGACAALFTNTVTVTVLQPPTAANAGPDQSYNGISATILAANNPSSGTGTWTQVSGPNTAVFANTSAYNSSVTGLAQGTYVFRWTITNGSCNPSTDEVTIQVLPPTTGGTVSADATVCATGGNSATLTLTGYAGNILQWESSTNGTTWDTIINTTSTYTYSNLTVTTRFRAQVKNGTDVALYSSVAVITVLQPVTPANAGPDQTLCDISSALLAANTPSSGNGVWSTYPHPSPLSFASAGNPNTNVSGLSQGTHNLVWTISNGVCPESKDTVQVVVVAPTNPGTVAADATVCATSNGGTLSISGYVGTIQQGEYSIDNGSTWQVYTNISTNTITYPTLTTTTKFRALVKNSVCPAVYSNAATITVLQAVTTSNAGADQLLCYTSSTTLSANNPGSGTGAWTVAAGSPAGASFTNPAAYNTAVSGLAPGTYQFVWTISNGTCADSKDTVSVTVYPLTVTGTLSGANTVCTGTNTGTLTLNGYTGNLIRWESSADGGNTWSNISNATNTYTYSNLTATTIYKVLVQSGVCTSAYSGDVTVTVNPATIPGTLSGTNTVCTGSNNGILTLSGNNGTVSRWEYSTNGGSTWTNIANTGNTHNYSNLTVTTIFRVLVQNGVCAGAYSNNITITVNPATVAGALSADATVCSGNNSGTLTLNGYTGSIINWESSTNSGTTWASIGNTGNTTYAYSNITATTIYRTQVQSGVCSAVFSNETTITVTPATVAGTLSGATTVCSGSNTGTLTLAGNNGSVIRWESSTDGGSTWANIANTTNTHTYNNLTSTIIYRAVVQNGVCSPVNSNQVTITVNPVTVPGSLSANATVCSGNNSGTLTLSGYTGTVLNWESSVDGGTTWSAISNNTNSHNYSNITVTTIYRVVVQSGVCASANSNQVTITVNPVTITGSLSANATVCSGNNTGTLTLTGNNGSITRWELSTDGGTTWTTVSNTTNTLTYNNITTTTIYRVLVQSGVCANGYSTQVTITVNPVTVAGTLTPSNSNVCSGGNTGTITLSGQTGAVIRWEFSTDGGASWNHINHTGTTYNYNNLTTPTQFRAYVQSGVCAAAYTTNSTINVTPTITNSIDNSLRTICSGQSVTITGQPATGGNGTYQYQWEQSTDGGNTWLTITGATGASITLAPTAVSVYVRRVVTSLPCMAISNTSSIVVQPALGNNSISSNNDVCVGAATPLITGTVPTGGDGNYQYSWEQSTDGGNTWSTVAGANGKDLSAGVLTVTTAFRRVVSSALCTGPQSITSSMVTVTLRPRPKAAFTALPALGCSPFSVQFVNQSVATGATHQFIFGDGTERITSAADSFTHVYRTNTLVTLYARLLVTNACGIDSALIPLTILPDNTVMNLVVSDTSSCGPVTVRFTNNTTGANSFTWNFGDNTPVSTTNTTGTVTHTYAASGTYRFTFSAYNGCSTKTITHTIRVHEVPVAAFVTNAPDFCIGDSVRFTNQSNYADTYAWQFGNGQTSTAASPAFVYTSSGNVPVSLIASRSFADDGMTCRDTASKSLTIVATRSGNMLVADTAGLCLPHRITAIGLSKPAASVQWLWGDGSSSTGDTARHTYNTNGNYSVMMISTTSGGCRYLDTTVVKVNGPAGTIGYNSAAVCLGQSSSFTASITDSNPHPADSIRWDFGNGTIVSTTAKNTTYVYTTPGSYMPKATLVKYNGCATILPATDTIRVDKVTARFKITAINDCGKTTYRFTDSSNAHFGVTKWKWLVNNKDSSSAKDLSYVFTNSGTHDASLAVQSATGCTHTLEARFDVQVYQYPLVTINAMSEACKSDLLQLKSNVSSQDSVVSRYWLLGNGVNAKDSIVNAHYLAEGKYTVKLTVGTINRCYDSVYKELTIHPLPVVSLAPERTVCKGDTVRLKANGATNYIWKDQYNNVICTNCTEPVVKPGQNTGYKVIGYNQYGCSEIKTTNIRVIQPLRMVASAGDTICAGDSRKLFATGAASYSWFPENGLSSSRVATPTAKPAATTTYRVIGKDAYSCFTDTANVTIVVGKPTPVSLGKDTVIMAGSTYQLQVAATSNDIRKWRWSGSPAISCATCPTPQIRLSDDACISCTVINQYGCASSDTVCIKTYCPTTEVFVPNAFTPDGDGVNDKLVIQGKGVKLVKSFRIFSRWGEVVFERTNFAPGDPAYAWDGKIRGRDASPDVYVYVCEVICEKGLPATFKGNTAILK